MLGAIAAMCQVVCPQARGQATGSALSLDIDADLSQRCGITRDGTEPAPADLDRAATLRFGFTLDCNAPFRIGVSASNGALAWVGSEQPDDGFAYRRGYDVSLDFETSGGTIRTEPCNAEDLRRPGKCQFFGREPGEGMSSGEDIAPGKRGALLISWPSDNGGSPRRAAGTYQDTITIIVGVRI